MRCNYKKPKLFGKDDDGTYKGLVEEIGTSRNYDMLYLSNRKPNWWVLSLVSGYRQIGIFKVVKGHDFKEGDLVIVTKKDNEVIEVKKDRITISNINEIFGYGDFKEEG